MIVVRFWITTPLLLGGFGLDRPVLVDRAELRRSARICPQRDDRRVGDRPDGEVRFNRPPADQRFIEPYSGVYFQVSGEGADTFLALPLGSATEVQDCHRDIDVHTYDSDEFDGEPLRISERDVILPGSKVRWRFQVAQSREMIDAQIKQLRSTLFWSFFALGIGLLILAALQTFYGLWPLRRVRQDVAAIRSGAKTRSPRTSPTRSAAHRRDQPVARP